MPIPVDIVEERVEENRKGFYGRLKEQENQERINSLLEDYYQLRLKYERLEEKQEAWKKEIDARDSVIDDLRLQNEQLSEKLNEKENVIDSLEQFRVIQREHLIERFDEVQELKELQMNLEKEKNEAEAKFQKLEQMLSSTSSEAKGPESGDQPSTSSQNVRKSCYVQYGPKPWDLAIRLPPRFDVRTREQLIAEINALKIREAEQKKEFMRLNKDYRNHMYGVMARQDGLQQRLIAQITRTADLLNQAASTDEKESLQKCLKEQKQVQKYHKNSQI